MDKLVDDVSKMFCFNECISLVDILIGGDGDKVLLDIILDVNNFDFEIFM